MLTWLRKSILGGEEVTETGGDERLDDIIAALRTVHDPEISTNIYDLGLIYAIDARGEQDIDICLLYTSDAADD